VKSPYPIFGCPGNHDKRAAYREGCSACRPVTPDQPRHEAAGAVFAMCDSTIPGRPEGFLADETIEWRERVLADEVGGAPAFVCFHQPPVELGARRSTSSGSRAWTDSPR
jgi:hypothetical protein